MNSNKKDTGLTGTWRCDNNSTYYIRQVQNSNNMNVYWYGESDDKSGAKNAFAGAFNDNDTFSGHWADLPDSSNNLFGQILLKIGADGNSFTLVGDNFGGKTWKRVPDTKAAK